MILAVPLGEQKRDEIARSGARLGISPGDPRDQPIVLKPLQRRLNRSYAEPPSVAEPGLTREPRSIGLRVIAERQEGDGLCRS